MATTHSYNVVSPAASYSMTVICIVFAIIGIIVSLHTVHHLFGRNQQNRVRMGASTKQWLAQCLIASFLAFCLFPSQRVLLYTWNPSTTDCRALAILSLILYIISKSGARGFFMRRLGDILGDTAVAYPQWPFLFSLCLTNTIVYSSQIVVAIKTALSAEPITLPRVNNVTGCATATVDAWYICFVLYSIIADVLWSSMMNWLLVRKLLVLIEVSMRSSISASTKNIFGASQRISPKSVQDFHTESAQNNQLLQVCSKLVILNAISCITSIVFIIVLFFSPSALLLDIVLNLITLWMNFKFAEKWYVRCQCHRFEACVFPLLKTCALVGRCHDVCCHCCVHDRNQEAAYMQRSSHSSVGLDEIEQSADRAESPTSEHTVDVDVASVVKNTENGCCSCCCTNESRNLWKLASGEYELYIKEEITGKI